VPDHEHRIHGLGKPRTVSGAAVFLLAHFGHQVGDLQSAGLRVQSDNLNPGERADETVNRRQKIVALVLGIAVALLAPALVWALVIAGLIQVTGSGVIVAVLGPVLFCVLVITVLIRVRSRRKR